MSDLLTSKVIWLAVLLWLATLIGGCSQASRAKWQSSADHTGQALTHTGGAIADGAEAVVLDVAWIAEQFQGAWAAVPWLGEVPLLGQPVTP